MRKKNIVKPNRPLFFTHTVQILLLLLLINIQQFRVRAFARFCAKIIFTCNGRIIVVVVVVQYSVRFYNNLGRKDFFYVYKILKISEMLD